MKTIIRPNIYNTGLPVEDGKAKMKTEKATFNCDRILEIVPYDHGLRVTLENIPVDDIVSAVGIKELIDKIGVKMLCMILEADYGKSVTERVM